MKTEREAYAALIRWANRAGRRGYWVRDATVIAPRTATDTSYYVALEEYHPDTTASGE